VDQLIPGKRRRPSPIAPGTMVVVQAGQATPFTVQPGQRVVVGRGPGADLVISDPSVSPTHALIERRGPGWLVSTLDPANPTWLLDPTGRAQEIESELGLRQGELLLGACQVLLYAPGA
jgi:predicted component of type VI protein secretion system